MAVWLCALGTTDEGRSEGEDMSDQQTIRWLADRAVDIGRGNRPDYNAHDELVACGKALKKAADALEAKDQRIAELVDENTTMRAALEEINSLFNQLGFSLQSGSLAGIARRALEDTRKEASDEEPIQDE